MSLEKPERSASPERAGAVTAGGIVEPDRQFARVPKRARLAMPGWSPMRVMVYLEIIGRCDNLPRYRVTARTIAEAIGRSVRRTQMAIAELEKGDAVNGPWIERIPPWTKFMHRGTPWRISHLQSAAQRQHAKETRNARRKRNAKERTETPAETSERELAAWKPENATLHEYASGRTSIDILSATALDRAWITNAREREAIPRRWFLSVGATAIDAIAAERTPTTADAVTIAAALLAQCAPGVSVEQWKQRANQLTRLVPRAARSG